MKNEESDMQNFGQPEHGEVVIYQSSDGFASLDVHLAEETVWLTQAQMAELFDRNKRTISEHLRNVFKERFRCLGFRQPSLFNPGSAPDSPTGFFVSGFATNGGRRSKILCVCWEGIWVDGEGKVLLKILSKLHQNSRGRLAWLWQWHPI